MIARETIPNGSFTDVTIRYDSCWSNQLTDMAMNDEDQDMRIYAAAGLMRILLDTKIEYPVHPAYETSINWVTNLIINAQAGRTDPPPASDYINNYLEGLDEIAEATLDATAIRATKTNIPEVTAAMLEGHIPANESKLLIAIGHGGILSGLRTYASLSGPKDFYPVRYSLDKYEDRVPFLSGMEKDKLRDMAVGRNVIVHDGYRRTGDSIHHLVEYFHREFEAPVYGMTPVDARHPGEYHPILLGRTMNSRFFDGLDPHSDKFREFVAQHKKPETPSSLLVAEEPETITSSTSAIPAINWDLLEM